jgi:excinuclease UvrABC nuclease subunit
MDKRLQAFVERHPEGWSHEEWLGLLAELGNGGEDVHDAAAVGLALEKTRLAWELSRCRVKGLGPKRREALVDRFETLWRLREAPVEDVAGVPTITQELAEQLVQAMRS